jgi:hypothetical protein
MQRETGSAKSGGWLILSSWREEPQDPSVQQRIETIGHPPASFLFAT